MLKKNIIFYLFILIIVLNILFQISIHQNIIQVVQTGMLEKSTLSLGYTEINVIVIITQVISIFITLLSIPIVSLILWFVAFLLGSKTDKKKFLFIYIIIYSLTSLKLPILAIFNVLKKKQDILYILNPNKLWIQLYDPFLWLSVVTIFILLYKLTDLSKRNSIFLSICYIAIQMFNLLITLLFT